MRYFQNINVSLQMTPKRYHDTNRKSDWPSWSSNTFPRVHWFKSICNHFTPNSDCDYTNSSSSSARCYAVLRIHAATILAHRHMLTSTILPVSQCHHLGQGIYPSYWPLALISQTLSTARVLLPSRPPAAVLSMSTSQAQTSATVT